MLNGGPGDLGTAPQQGRGEGLVRQAGSEATGCSLGIPKLAEV